MIPIILIICFNFIDSYIIYTFSLSSLNTKRLLLFFFYFYSNNVIFRFHTTIRNWITFFALIQCFLKERLIPLQNIFFCIFFIKLEFHARFPSLFSRNALIVSHYIIFNLNCKFLRLLSFFTLLFWLLFYLLLLKILIIKKCRQILCFYPRSYVLIFNLKNYL